MSNSRKLKTIQVTAPSQWASYLINGDASGMDADEIEACDAFVASLEFQYCVDVSLETEFTPFHDAVNFALAADCATYTFSN